MARCPHVLRLEPVVLTLPAGFDALCAAASAEGHHMLARLDDEWRTGVQLFDQPGEMLLAAFEDGALHGIGGMTLCPTIAGALRMRRFYVAAAARRRGVARALARALLEQVPLSVATLTVHAGSPAAASFWESLDFRAAGCAGISHRRAVAAGEAMLSAMTSPAVPP